VRWTVLVLACLIVACVTMPGIPAQSIVSQDETIYITIAYTHDIHGHLYPKWSSGSCSGGMARLSTKVQQLRDVRPVLLLDCGDILSGGATNDHNDGIPMVEVMNSIGYDAMALDNHEFDQGLTVLSGMIQAADFNVLSANTEWSGTPQAADYSIEEISGYQIGIIGLTPSFWYAPDGVVFSDLAESASIAVSELEAQGVNFIIILGCVSSGLANSVPGVDLIVKGGGPEMIGDTLSLPSVGSYGSSLGVLNLTINISQGTIETYSFSSHGLDSTLEPDPVVEAIIDGWDAPLSEYLDTPVGYFDAYLSSSNVGPLLAEALWQQTGADVGVYNGGGVREGIDSGFVTYRDLYHVEPFFNFVATVDAPGWIAEQIVSSNYHATSITTFESDTIYTIASSNFSITSFEWSYGLDLSNRQDTVGTSVVEAFAAHLSDTFPIEMPDLQDALIETKNVISSLPDESFAGGVPSDLRASMNNELTSAQTALGEDALTDASSYVLTVVDLVSDHVITSCPRRWLMITLNCIIYGLEDVTSPTTPSDTTPTTPTSVTTEPIPLDLGGIMIAMVVTLTILALIGVFWKLRRESA